MLGDCVVVICAVFGSVEDSEIELCMGVNDGLYVGIVVECLCSLCLVEANTICI